MNCHCYPSYCLFPCPLLQTALFAPLIAVLAFAFRLLDFLQTDIISACSCQRVFFKHCVSLQTHPYNSSRWEITPQIWGDWSFCVKNKNRLTFSEKFSYGWG